MQSASFPSAYSSFLPGFITDAYTKFNEFSEGVQNHTRVGIWQKDVQQDAKAYLAIKWKLNKNILSQIYKSILSKIVPNRNKLMPFLSTIIFCGTHDIAFQEKHSHTGYVQDFYEFRVETSDKTFDNHFQTSSGNAWYIFHRTQHEFIDICQEVIRSDIVTVANTSTSFSISTDETADIQEREQLPMGVRCVEILGNCCCTS